MAELKKNDSVCSKSRSKPEMIYDNVPEELKTQQSNSELQKLHLDNLL